MNDECNKTYQQESIVNIINPAGLIFKKSIPFINSGKYIYDHPYQNNGNCIDDPCKKFPCFVFYAHIDAPSLKGGYKV
jgi:hypothetical protein